MKSARSFLIAALLVCLSANSVDAFHSISVGIPGVIDPYAPCPGPDTPGGTTLYPIEYLPIPGPGVFYALEWQFSGEQRYTPSGTESRPPEQRWSFDLGGPLNGDLLIDLYYAYDQHHNFGANDEIVWDPDGDWCRHGAHLSASYVRDPVSDPPLDLLEWVQILVAPVDWHGVPPGTPLVDPFYNDGTDDAPFYFSNLDDPLDYYLGENLFADIIFGDTPGVSHPEADTFSWNLDLYLFLASRDPLDPYHVFIHDGIFWGYEGVCVPVPASLLLSLLGLGAVAAWRRERIRV